jgi:hypothetical protein
MKSTIFWDITTCSSLSVNGCFKGTCRLHLHGRKNKMSKTSLKAGDLRPWRWRRYIPLKRRLTLNVISQKMVLFITTAVRTSGSTKWNSCLIYPTNSDIFNNLIWICKWDRYTLPVMLFIYPSDRSFDHTIAQVVRQWFLTTEPMGSVPGRSHMGFVMD